jgi:hypothetical protein
VEHVGEKIFSKKSKKHKDGVCLPKTSQLKKGFNELKNLMSKKLSSKSFKKLFKFKKHH